MDDPIFRLADTPVHLGLGASASVLEPFDGTPAWYERYGAARGGDGVEGRLVALHTFTEPWPTWEVHPHGHELVVCTEGRVTLHQELDAGVHTVSLGPGDAVINPPGVWHTVDVDDHATVLFVTAGLGTENRAR